VGVQALCNHEVVNFRPEFLTIICVYDYRFTASPSSFEGVAWRNHKLFRNESFRVGKIDSINPALIRSLIEKRNTRGIGLHNISNVR
jgi:hypothetical protein